MRSLAFISAAPLGKYKLCLAFNDGTEDTVDLSDMAGKGVFTAGKKMIFLIRCILLTNPALLPGREIWILIR